MTAAHVVTDLEGGLDAAGISPKGKVHWNLGVPALIEHAIRRGEGVLSAHGAFVTNTAPRTGRSPDDKFIVREPGSEEHIWWGKVNRPISPAGFDQLRVLTRDYLSSVEELFVQDLYCGADPEHQLQIRVVTENAWHSVFARNMFVRPTETQLETHSPQFTVLHAPNLQAPELDELSSGAFVVVNYAEKTVLIGGTKYAGEIKKSIFSVMNYLLPLKDVLPMHSSSNTTGDNTAIFFGLSGTGKTTLSADPDRALVGDDEHGWSSNGVFNFEGGCYAKLVDLSEKDEPAIYATTRKFGTILENVILDDERVPDFNNKSVTENTRGSYPLTSIENRVDSGRAGQPQNVVFLTCDAFGVLPPVSKLSPAQAAYHFISGYTAKVAGTEVGVTEPQATFSSCFGAPFMPMHPSVYADLLQQKMGETGANCWLINTGWSGGPYGVGARMSIKHTRTLLNACLDGTLSAVEFRSDNRFGFEVPTSCPNVPQEILDPRNTWENKESYDETANKLARMFNENFTDFSQGCSDEINGAAPKPLN